MENENLEPEGVEVDNPGILKKLAKKEEGKKLEEEAMAYKKIKIKKTRIIPEKEEELEYSVKDLEDKIVEIETDIKSHYNKINELEEDLNYMNNLLLEFEEEAKKLK